MIKAHTTLLDALFHPGDGWIELRALPSTGRTFIQPGDVAALNRFIEPHGGENIYFGVAARKDGSSGKLENCSAIRALFVDLDFKTSSEAECRKQLAAFPLPPSIVVNSGFGLHCYWILDAPQSPAATKEWLRRLARALGGDMASAEPAHVLRPPGTLNHKYDPPRRVAIESSTDAVYALEDFEFLPAEPERKVHAPANGNGNGRAHHRIDDRIRRAERYLDAIPGAIEGQGGDAHTYRTACKLVRDFGLAESEALDLLLRWNQSCVPPWTESELVQKTRNAERYGENPPGWKLNEERPHNGNGNHRAAPDDADFADDRVDDHYDGGEPAEPRPVKYSDDAIADLFTSQHHRDFRYVDSWGWLQYDGRRWQRVPDVVVMGHARRTCRAQAEFCKQD